MAHEYRRHDTQPIAPVSRNTPATMGDLANATETHESNCARERAHEHEQHAGDHAQVWKAITDVKLTLEGINARLRAAVWIVGLCVALAGGIATVGVFVARYAIVGAITEQLDRRLPPVRMTAAPQSSGLGIISSAQAAEGER